MPSLTGASLIAEAYRSLTILKEGFKLVIVCSVFTYKFFLLSFHAVYSTFSDEVFL